MTQRQNALKKRQKQRIQRSKKRPSRVEQPRKQKKPAVATSKNKAPRKVLSKKKGSTEAKYEQLKVKGSVKNRKPKKKTKAGERKRPSKKTFGRGLRRQFRRKSVRKVLREVRDFLLIFVILLSVVLTVSSFFFSIHRVKGYSMSPTLRDADTIFILKTQEVKRLDLLVFEGRTGQEVRRIIGLPGDRIEYVDDVLYVNSEIVNEAYIIEHINEAQRNGGHYTEDFNMQALTGEAFVPEGSYFVLGDNRKWATDSRNYGFIEANQIVGVVRARLLPINTLATFTIFCSGSVIV
ncbi:signal peptidase I [Enterococcus sp. LJL90]